MKQKKTGIFIIVLIFLISFEFANVFKSISSKVSYNNVTQIVGDVGISKMRQGDIIEQSFVSNEDSFSAIEIMFGNTNDLNKGNIKFTIKEDGKEDEIYSTELSIEALKDSTYTTFNFKPIRNAKGKKYKFYIEILESSMEKFLSFNGSSQDLYKEGEAKVNGKSVLGDLQFNVKSKTSYPRTYTLITITFLLTMLGIFILIFRYNIPLHKSFLMFSIIYGILFFFIIPPSQSPDEPVHLYRAYEISTGNMISINKNGIIGNYMPTSFEDMFNEIDHGRIAFNRDEKVDFEKFKNAFSVKLNPDNKEMHYFGGASVYVPIQYIPQSTGLLIARVFKTSALTAFYLAKFFNFITWILLAYFAIKIIPFGKEILLTLALLPITMQQAVSVSPDVMIFGLSFLFIALCLKYNRNPDFFGRRQKILIAILAMSIPIIKIVYLPLLLLLFMLPKNKFKTKANFNWYIFLIFILSLGISGLWLLYVNSNLTISAAPFPGVNTAEQIKFALKNPFTYSLVIRNSVVNNFKFYIESGVGIIGWLDTQLPFTLICGYFAVFVLLTFFTGTVKEDSKRVLFISTFSITLILVFSSLYAGWTPVGSPQVDGVQGRYFIPVIPLLLMSGPNIKTGVNRKNMNKYLYIFLNWAIVYSLIIIFKRYYIY